MRIVSMSILIRSTLYLLTNIIWALEELYLPSGVKSKYDYIRMFTNLKDVINHDSLASSKWIYCIIVAVLLVVQC